ncbi:MAG: hypothetical protein M3Z16_04810 [Pseudomonadota bacterium]|nr:hypothetical protein [Pseudomonadota bacterium]
MSPEGDPQRRGPDDVVWPGPSRRARAIAAALAVAFALITFAVVNHEWRRAAPPPPAPPTSVEARLIASPPPPTSPTGR